MVLPIIVILAVTLFAAFPMFLVLGLPPLISVMTSYREVAPYIIVQRWIAGVSPFPLIAVPLFILAAEIMLKGELSSRLTNFAMKLVGHIHGGLAQTLCLSCLIFGALSGSVQATVAAIGGVMYPNLKEAGYKDTFALGLVVASAEVAQLIPPSISAIVYGVLTGTSIGALFLGGILPGIIMGLLYMAYSWWWAKKHGVPRLPRATFPEIATATREAFWPLGLPVVIIGGIYTGVLTPTEAAAAAIAYAFFVAVVIYKSMGIRDVYSAALKTGTTTAIVFVILAASEGLSWVLTYGRVPQLAAQAAMALQPSPLLLLMLINLIFFIALMFFDGLAAKVVLVPIVFPIAKAYGIDPVHLGVLVTINCTIGTITPPYGCDLFTASALFNEPYAKVVRGVPIFIVLGVIVLLLATFFPGLSTWIPSMAFK